ncbi:MAG: hypothetical protein Q4G07_08805 [Oscillospiraceae bacterium]|nr:hypothetical protein [Oscillospiraceae bacterium]
MSNRIENLGDYNKARIDLQEAGGSLSRLYDKIGTTAVMKAAPVLMLAGAGMLYIGQKCVRFFKKRKEMIKDEPELKKQFAEAVETETVKSIGERDL